jgi:hypothetical protein
MKSESFRARSTAALPFDQELAELPLLLLLPIELPLLPLLIELPLLSLGAELGAELRLFLDTNRPVCVEQKMYNRSL